MSYTLLTQYDSPNYTPQSQAKPTYGMERKIEGITIHWWGDPKQNPTFDGIVSYLSRESGSTSAHVVASGTNRQVAWLVDADNIAWHTGSAKGNATTIGIECDPRCRDEDYDVVAEVIADIWKTYGKLPLYRHSDWIATACPGNYNLARLQDLAEKKMEGEEMETYTRDELAWTYRLVADAEPTDKELDNYMKSGKSYKHITEEIKRFAVDSGSYQKRKAKPVPESEAAKKLAKIESIVKGTEK